MKVAKKVFDKGTWSKVDCFDKSRILNRFADLLEKNANQLAALESLDNGKPVSAAHIDIGFGT